LAALMDKRSPSIAEPLSKIVYNTASQGVI
jgi:hypothetical protein